MALIVNPTPITTNVFNGYWITQLRIVFPQGKDKGVIMGQLMPYDGTHLLATGRKQLYVTDLAAKRTTDTALDAMLTAVAAELKRQSQSTEDPKLIDVFAPDPTKPVMASVVFNQAEGAQRVAPYRVKDCYALAATDSTFAGVFQQTMAEVASLAGLTVQ